MQKAILMESDKLPGLETMSKKLTDFLSAIVDKRPLKYILIESKCNTKDCRYSTLLIESIDLVGME